MSRSLREKSKIFTIDDRVPVWICGSGILDVVAEMKAANLIDEKGTLIEGQFNIRKGKKNSLEFLLVPAASSGHGRDIIVSRKDVNEIQLAKAAIRAGQEILLTIAGVTVNDINEVIIAGAFGTYINVPNAIKVGMLPNVPVKRFRQVGNAAGMGAVQALVSSKHRNMINDVIKNINYIELTTCEDFQREFLKAMYLR